MNVKRVLAAAVLVAAVSGCAGGEDEAATETTVPLTVPSTSSTSSTTTTSTTTSTTTTEVPESSSTTTVAAAVPSDIELTWAQEGTPEADVERAFWTANNSRREAVEMNDPGLAEFVNSHTGRELERLIAAFASSEANAVTYRYPEKSTTLIEFISLVSEVEALMQICELDRAEYYINGVLDDDRDFDSQFQARMVLGDDGVWRWEERIKLRFEPLDEELPTCMLESQN